MVSFKKENHMEMDNKEKMIFNLLDNLKMVTKLRVNLLILNLFIKDNLRIIYLMEKEKSIISLIL
jgi:hypothetical protein